MTRSRLLRLRRGPGVRGAARDHRAQPRARGAVPGACVLHAAGIWLLLQAEFLAIALVLVYVGAVMVLFLFVVMMLDINFDALRDGFWSYLPIGGHWSACSIAGRDGAGAAGAASASTGADAARTRRAAGYSNTQGARHRCSTPTTSIRSRSPR